MPILVMHGDKDLDLPRFYTQGFWDNITANTPYRKWVEIPNATFQILQEKSRVDCFRTLLDFLDAELPVPLTPDNAFDYVRASTCPVCPAAETSGVGAVIASLVMIAIALML